MNERPPLPGTRPERRQRMRTESRARRRGAWGLWEEMALPAGLPGGHGWCRDVRRALKNALYCVLVRPSATEWGVVHHLAISNVSGQEPPWRDKQRIKNELFGQDFTAIEVMPPAGETVDAADMYHIWVLPPGFLLPFTIGTRT